MADRVMVYIDGSNLYHSLNNEFGRTNLDFFRFSKKLVGEDRQLVRTYYYNAPLDYKKQPEQYRSQQKFFDALRRIEYFEVRLGRLVYSKGWPSIPPTEKGVDIRIATDMLVHAVADNYDVAVLVSGDTDFVDAVQAVKGRGLHVEAALFPMFGSQTLRDAVDKEIMLDSYFLSDCWIGAL